MIPTLPKIRPAAKIPGGKYYMSDRLVRMMPAHDLYVSASAGMFSDMLNKPRVPVEVLNDLDWFTFNLINCLRDYGDEFRRIVRNIPYTVEVFICSARRLEIARTKYNLNEPIDWPNVNTPDTPQLMDAIDLYVVRRMSRGGRGTRNAFADHARKSFAWSDRLRGGRPGDENAWITGNEENLPLVIERLQDVRTMNVNADQIYSLFGQTDGVLIYDDPPYFHGTRSAARLYGSMEMDDSAHARRLVLANGCRCMLMISGYDNNLYRAVLGDGRTMLPNSGRPNLFGFEPWRCRRFDLPNNQSESDKKQRRLECVWTNFEPDEPAIDDDPEDVIRRTTGWRERKRIADAVAKDESKRLERQAEDADALAKRT